MPICLYSVQCECCRLYISYHINVRTEESAVDVVKQWWAEGGVRSGLRRPGEGGPVARRAHAELVLRR